MLIVYFPQHPNNPCSPHRFFKKLFRNPYTVLPRSRHNLGTIDPHINNRRTLRVRGNKGDNIMSVYLVTNGEHAGAWLADDVVKRNAIIAAHDDAYIAAQHDVATGTGADPAPTPEQERYIKAYIEGFVAEFVKLYPKAYATAYKRTYRAAYTAAALERANPLDDRIAETARINGTDPGALSLKTLRDAYVEEITTYFAEYASPADATRAFTNLQAIAKELQHRDKDKAQEFIDETHALMLDVCPELDLSLLTRH